MKVTLIQKITLAAGFTLIALSSPTMAETKTDSAEPLVLRGIMQEVGVKMQDITAAISREDWNQVEESATWIADHPRPPVAERMRIMSFIGKEASAFKSNDKNTHKSAQALAKAAINKDGQAVIVEFAKLQNSCLVCHEKFRPLIQEHFYGQK